MLERIAVFDDVIFNCSVIDGTEYACVERYGVWCNATTLMPCLVSLHYLGGETVEHYVLVLSVIVFRRLSRQELLETAERRLVGLGSPDLTVLF